MTTQQKIAILSRDFLDRDAGTFTASRQTGRLDWESTIGAGGAYSEFILHPKSTEELIKSAHTLATDMLKVMDTPHKVTVKITPDNSCTDSSTVWVATKVFDDADLSVGHKLDTFIGLAVHEGCHLLYTDFHPSDESSSAVLALQNIIEDERIERECGQSRPGLSNFLAASKYYYFDKYRQELLKQGRLESLSTPKRLLNAILSFVRYPKALEASDLSEFCDVLLAVRDALSPYPSSTAESLEAARKIYEAMKDYVQEPTQQQSSGGSKSQESTSDEQNADAATGSNSREASGKSNCESIEKATAQMSGALKHLAKATGDNGLTEDDMSATVKEEGGKVGQICEGSLERGCLPDTFIAKAPEDKDVYRESLDRVRQYIPAISKALRCQSMEYKYSLRGMRSGMLDTGKLAEAFQGVPTVYIREGEVKSDKIAVCILLDESGSMWGAGEQAARDTAVLLNEALSGINNIDLYIYGHTASRKTTSLFVYRERGFNKKYALGTTGSRAGNHDSIAIREAAARIRRFTREDCLFFVISDGAPNESTWLVKKAVQDVSKNGFNLIAVSIDPYYDPATMYDNNVVFSDLPSLAINLGKMIRSMLLNEINRK